MRIITLFAFTILAAGCGDDGKEKSKDRSPKSVESGADTQSDANVADSASATDSAAPEASIIEAGSDSKTD